MASQEDPRQILKKLAVKQMKSALHARFLQDCINDDIVPKGLRLSLKVSVGPDGKELQDDINKLLHKVSVEICERIKEDHLRHNDKTDNMIENTRRLLQNKLTTSDFSNLENEITSYTEDKKNDIVIKHEKKLTYLREEMSKSRSTLNKNGNHSPVTTDSISTSPQIVNYNSEQDWQTVKKKQRSSKSTKKFTVNKNVNNISTKAATTTKTGIIQPTLENQKSKNVKTPGTKKTYREAVINGEPKNLKTNQLLQKMDIVLQEIKEIAMITTKQNHEGSKNSRHEINIKNIKSGKVRYNKVKKQC